MCRSRPASSSSADPAAAAPKDVCRSMASTSAPPLSGGGVSSYIPDIANSQEVTFTTSGGLGEAEVGGPTMNIVPKTGGNALRGTSVSRRRQPRHGRQQLHRRAAGRRTARAGRAAEAVGLHGRRWRPDPQGSHLVLRERRARKAAGSRCPACIATRTPATRRSSPTCPT